MEAINLPPGIADAVKRYRVAIAPGRGWFRPFGNNVHPSRRSGSESLSSRLLPLS